jgi:hypothetical protein
LHISKKSSTFASWYRARIMSARDFALLLLKEEGGAEIEKILKTLNK